MDSVRMFFQKRLIKAAGTIQIETEVVDGFWNIIPADGALVWSEIQPFFHLLQPGDIMFSATEKYLSNLFIPWLWQHAVIYLWNRQILDVNEDGVMKRNFDELFNLQTISFLKSLIAFRIQRSDEEIESFVAAALTQIGKPYDFDFNIEDDSSLYCSELIRNALNEIGISLQTTNNFLREMISPSSAVAFMQGDVVLKNDFIELFHLSKEGKNLINLTEK